MSVTLRGLLVSILLAAAAAQASDLSSEIRTVERLRQRSFLHKVDHRTVTREELPAILRQQMLKSMPVSPDDYIVVLRALQLVDDDPHLLDKLLDLYQEQILAFYDPLAHVFYSLDKPPPALEGAELPMLEESVAVHELTHALQDQRFGAGEKLERIQGDWDAELAYDSLIEGEASLVMMAAILDKGGRSLDEVMQNDFLLNALKNAGASDRTIPAGSPRYFVESMKFPYLDGLAFVIDAYRRGGWAALDRVHANPPRTTREILHPAEYFARVAADPKAVPSNLPPTIPGTLVVEHLGEFHWRFLLGEAASTGWVSDSATVVQNARCETSVLVLTQWESEADAATFLQAYLAFLRDRGIDARSQRNGTWAGVAYGADPSVLARIGAKE
ncbi:MAG TPA: hypothetical protein VEZ11_05895 [Thermoanaerobaculia bacterium]|nr:hypothetical protein [Thermoanaerobaculia bacterium]